MNPKPLNIEKGKTLSFKLYLYRKSDGRPYDLTGVEEITLSLPGEAATQEFTMTGEDITVDEAKAGECTVEIAAADLDSLEVGERQDYEVDISMPSDVEKRVRFPQGVNVFESAFSD